MDMGTGVPLTGPSGLLSAAVITASFATLHAVALPATKVAFPVLYANLTKHKKLADWRNYTVSFLFILMASAAVISIISSQGRSMDLMESVCPACKALVVFMLGYCVSDTVDMYRSGTLGIDMIFHHGVIIVAYSASVLNGLYAPYLAATLIAETNTIFLHGRKLMQLAGVERESTMYRSNLLLLLLGFPAQRVVPHLWLLSAIYKDRSRFVEPWHFYLAFSGLLIINVLNFILLRSILYADRKLIFSGFNNYRMISRTKSNSPIQSAHAAAFRN